MNELSTLTKAQLNEIVKTLPAKQRAGFAKAAQAAAKDLILDVAGKTIDRELIENTARRIATIRASDEGREGLNAFLEKRRPDWVNKH